MSGKILKFNRYPDGSCEALIAYEKTVTVSKSMGCPARPAGLTQDEHEGQFFRDLAEHIAVDQMGCTVDTSAVEGKEIAVLVAAAPPPKK